MSDYRKPGDIIELHGRQYERLPNDVRYDYENGDRCKCPNCGGLGTPWRGWFNCEGDWGLTDCGSIFIIETGEGFKPLPIEEIRPK